jgi:hypothetical protein
LRGRLVQIVACVLAVCASAFAVGCGSDDEAAAGEGLAELAPPDAPFFVEGVIDPDDDQVAAIDSLTGRFGFDPGAALAGAIDSEFAGEDEDLTFADDVEPWLGDHAAAFVLSFEASTSNDVGDFAALIEVTDVDAANDFMAKAAEASGHETEERSYDGTDYLFDTTDSAALGIVDGRALVAGSEQAFKVAVDAASGESLAGSEDYTSHLEPLPDDAIATAYFDPGTLASAAIASGDVDPAEAQMVKPLLSGLLSEPVGAALTVEADSASIDVASTIDSDAPESTQSSLLEDLPGDAWLAAGMPDLGPTLQRNLDRIINSGLPGASRLEAGIERTTGLDLNADVFSWLGDAAGFVSGTGAPGIKFGVVAETSDPNGPRKLLAAVQRLIEKTDPPPSTGPPEGADYGFSFGLPGVGGGAEAGVIGDMLVGVFGASVDQVLHPETTLGDDAGYSAAVSALGDDMAPALFLDLPEAIAVAQIGAADDPLGEGPDYQAIQPYLGDLGSLIAGSRHSDGLLITRTTVTLTPQ